MKFEFYRTTMEKGMFQASAVAKVGDCVDVTKSDFKFDVKVRSPIYIVLAYFLLRNNFLQIFF